MQQCKDCTLQNTDITILQLHVLYEKYSALKTRSAPGNQKSQQVSEIFFPCDLYASNLLCDTTQMFRYLFSSFNTAHINKYYLCVLYIWEV